MAVTIAISTQGFFFAPGASSDTQPTEVSHVNSASHTNEREGRKTVHRDDPVSIAVNYNQVIDRQFQKIAAKQARIEARQQARQQARAEARAAAAAAASRSQDREASGTATRTITTSGGLPYPWNELANCESGGNPRAVNDDYAAESYYGLFQFSLSTWASVGGSGNPIDASPEEQLERAQELQARSGWGPWPQCAASLGL